MALLQENIFDIVKRANPKNYVDELISWKIDSTTYSSRYDEWYKKGMIFNKFKEKK